MCTRVYVVYVCEREGVCVRVDAGLCVKSDDRLYAPGYAERRDNVLKPLTRGRGAMAHGPANNIQNGGMHITMWDCVACTYYECGACVYIRDAAACVRAVYAHILMC